MTSSPRIWIIRDSEPWTIYLKLSKKKVSNWYWLDLRTLVQFGKTLWAKELRSENRYEESFKIVPPYGPISQSDEFKYFLFKLVELRIWVRTWSWSFDHKVGRIGLNWWVGKWFKKFKNVQVTLYLNLS